MTFCRRCSVKLPGDEDVCVLCGSRTERLDDTRRRDYPEIRSSGVFRTVVRLLALVSVAFVIASLYLNWRFESDVIWSLIALAATVYCWLTFFFRKSYRNPGLMIFVQLLAVSALGYLIDLSTGNHGWMIDYVIPGLLIAAQGVMTVIMIVRPALFREFILYELEIAVLGIGSVLLTVFGVTEVWWPYCVVSVYSALLLAGTFIFADRRTRQELVKRFHF